MTKTIKLTKAYIDNFNSGLMKGRKFHDKYDFFTHTPPPRSGGEGYKPRDVAKDPTNVPIYDQIEGSLTYGEIIRYEGSVSDPIEYYGCNYGEELIMPTIKANKWLAAKVNFRDNEKMIPILINGKIIGYEENPDYNKIISKDIFEEVL